MPGSARSQIGRSTVRDWIELYQTHGLDGLKPIQRADAGRSRAIPEPVQELLLSLRAERPGASLASLIRAVQLSGRVAPTLRLTRSAVHRFFTAQAVPSAAVAATAGEPDALAFTHPHANDLWVGDIILQKIWERLRQQAGLPDLRMHDLRHSFASIGASAGMGLPILGSILGHTNPSTTARYAHLADDPRRAAAEQIAGHIAAALSGKPEGELIQFKKR